jgi:hypothetical protein
MALTSLGSCVCISMMVGDVFNSVLYPRVLLV